MNIELVPCLSDNYAYLIRDDAADMTAVVDPAEEEPVARALEARGWRLTHILNTHHHFDHVGGNEALKLRHGATIIAPQAEQDQIPAVDVGVKDGEVFPLGNAEVHVLSTPAHTAGHISFHIPAVSAVFVGDTMFSMGCGRLFEGTAQDMWRSLSKLMTLPDDTRVYCGHEYTQSNARFALTIDPGNADLKARAAEVEELRAKGQPTIPTTLGLEKRTSPFLRAADPTIRKTLGMEGAEDWEVFAEIRRRKDTA